VDELLASQRAYYDLRAADYADATKPADRKTRSLFDAGIARALVDELAPSGDVLEIACGPGLFTRELARHARSLTALDGSARMLARNRREVAEPAIEYIEADVLTWAPDRAYDVVFFGFWLSHVPPGAFEPFWTLVRACLKRGGRVGFVDEDERAAEFDDIHLVDSTPVAVRTLSDGSQFDIVKVNWKPSALEARLRALDWNVRVRPVGAAFLYGAGT
jgi:demethylmenaquinone methyltransferase/2-methoxy-6-polyprenyl-1,4-benzoquinol methylase